MFRNYGFVRANLEKHCIFKLLTKRLFVFHVKFDIMVIFQVDEYGTSD